MPSGISRLRFWVGTSALLAIALVAGFYLYARYRVHRAVQDLPGKLGVNIQQNTQGFTYSQAAGGHTIFSITASNAIRYKQGGKAELHNVKIVSYGRDSDRLDEISGDDFEYDAQSGDVTAKGKVDIQLQATESGTSAPGGTPSKVGSPLHLNTSGLIFNQKTGIARTSEKISFQLPQGTGSAVGAVYNSKQNSLNLLSNVHLLTAGPSPVDLHAGSASFTGEGDEVMLADLHADSGLRRGQAQRVILHLRSDNTVERAEASGGLSATLEGARGAQIQARQGSFVFAADNKLSSGRLRGDVDWETRGGTVSHGTAGEALIVFGRNDHIKSVQLRENVDFAQTPSARDGAQQVEFVGDGLDLQIANGKELQIASSVGTSHIVLEGAASSASSKVPVDSSKSRTTISAGRFDVKFANNRISTLTGTAPVKIVSSADGKAERTSESNDLLATFSKGKTQTLEDAIQNGNVQIQEGQRSATADRATLHQADASMTLSGNVHYKDASTGATLSSNTLTLNRATGETTASGEVKTTYAEQKAQSSGGMLSASQAVHVTAPAMVARNSTGEARYSGGARLWQGGNMIQAPTIEFSRSSRILTATGQNNHRVSTVFVQPDRNGKQIPVEISADELRYVDSERRAVFRGSLIARSADSTLKGEQAVVLLKGQPGAQPSLKSSPSDSPSQVQTIEVTGDVSLHQPGRRAVGDRLVYTADDQKFVLTGTPGAPPSIFDAEHGQVTGVSLTFFNRDARVLVDSSNSTSITQTRFKK